MCVDDVNLRRIMILGTFLVSSPPMFVFVEFHCVYADSTTFPFLGHDLLSPICLWMVLARPRLALCVRNPSTRVSSHRRLFHRLRRVAHGVSTTDFLYLSISGATDLLYFNRFITVFAGREL